MAMACTLGLLDSPSLASWPDFSRAVTAPRRVRTALCLPFKMTRRPAASTTARARIDHLPAISRSTYRLAPTGLVPTSRLSRSMYPPASTGRRLLPIRPAVAMTPPSTPSRPIRAPPASPRRSSWVAAAPRRPAPSRCRPPSPATGEPEPGRRSTLRAGVEQLHLARRMVLVRRRRRPVRRHLPGLGDQRGQSDPGGRLRVGELLRGLSPGGRRLRRRHQLVLCRLAVHRRFVRGLRARRTGLHDDRRVLFRDVPERHRASAPWAASASRRPAARRANAATGAASAPSIRSCATAAA